MNIKPCLGITKNDKLDTINICDAWGYEEIIIT